MPNYTLRNAQKVLPVLVNPSSGYPDLDTLTINHKFGRNDTVGTSLEPITISGMYNTTTVLTTLEAVSDDANDTAAGTGARTLQILGLVAGWVEGNSTVSMDGTAAVSFGTDFYRVWRAKVLTSGSYATQSTSSQKGTITIRKEGGGATWAQLDEAQAGFGVAQSQIGVYSIPAGKVAYIPYVFISVDSGKTASIYLFVREGADTVAAPFSPMQLKQQIDGVQGSLEFQPQVPFGPYVGPCDIGFMGKVASTVASVTVDFTIMQFDLVTT